jgi:hypothetical protein
MNRLFNSDKVIWNGESYISDPSEDEEADEEIDESSASSSDEEN